MLLSSRRSTSSAAMACHGVDSLGTGSIAVAMGVLYRVDDGNKIGMHEIRDRRRHKVSHRPVELHQDQKERPKRPRYLGMPRDFSETKLLERLIVRPGRKVKLAKDFATSWKEGRAFDKRQAG